MSYNLTDGTFVCWIRKIATQAEICYVWKARNLMIFEGLNTTASQIIQNIDEDIRIKGSKVHNSYQNWCMAMEWDLTFKSNIFTM